MDRTRIHFSHSSPSTVRVPAMMPPAVSSCWKSFEFCRSRRNDWGIRCYFCSTVPRKPRCKRPMVSSHSIRGPKMWEVSLTLDDVYIRWLIAYSFSQKAFLNLESVGSNGKEILFQSGPNHAWLIDVSFASIITMSRVNSFLLNLNW